MAINAIFASELIRNNESRNKNTLGKDGTYIANKSPYSGVNNGKKIHETMCAAVLKVLFLNEPPEY